MVLDIGSNRAGRTWASRPSGAHGDNLAFARLTGKVSPSKTLSEADHGVFDDMVVRPAPSGRAAISRAGDRTQATKQIQMSVRE
jgi:hypothetical protein